MTITLNVLVSGGSVLGLLGTFVWLILTGRLVPASQLDAVREDRDKAVTRAGAETDRWRSAYEFSEQARRVDAGHVAELLEGVRITGQVLTALPGTSAQASGESNVATAA
jgi:hypothetical protein